MGNQTHQIPLCDGLITAALAEDIGTGDVTSELLIPSSAMAELRFVAREPMVACGMFIPSEVYKQIDKKIRVKELIKEGEYVKKNTVLAIAFGSARALLAGERVALNFMQHLCGVATLTHRYVTAIHGTGAAILDTRKTIPAFRLLDKYAVHTGGGQNHRMGLYDAILIKDNHIALSGSIIEAVRKARKKKLPVIVECDTLSQVRDALAANPDRIILDNMDLKALRAAVKLVKGKIPLEASGGASLKTVRAIAKTGVDYISVGKLTHSAPAADIGADIEIS